MAYEKQTWVPYDDNKTEEQNINDGAVVTAERMNHIENGVEAQATKIELKNHLEDKENPHEVTAHQVGALTAEESSANVIYQVIGKEKVRIPIEADLNKKVAGSILENGNIASYRTGATLYKPNEFSADSYINYSNLAALDNNIQRLSNSITGNISQMFVQYDLIDIVTRKLGSSFWTNQGADTLQKKVSILKKITCSNVDSRVWGFGDSPSGNSLKCANWVSSSSWQQQPQAHTMQNKITKITTTNTIGGGITDDGKWNTIAYAEVSDGASSSSLSIDYAQLEFTIEISVNEFILSTIAANHEENIGNVDNYGTATQAEAEAGSASDKFMTPLGTKQYVSSRVATQTETEGGTSSEKLMTPLRTKQHVDSRMADFSEISVGQSDDKIVSPKALKEASIIPIKISEWTNIPLDSTAEAADNTTPQYRIITFSSGENTRTKVEFRGAVRNSSTHNMPSGGSSLVVAMLPENIRTVQTVIVPSATNHLSFMGRAATLPSGWLGVGNKSGTTLDYVYLNNLSYWLD